MLKKGIPRYFKINTAEWLKKCHLINGDYYYRDHTQKTIIISDCKEHYQVLVKTPLESFTVLCCDLDDAARRLAHLATPTPKIKRKKL